MIYADLDGFKLVNDLHGHHTGDQVIRIVGERIASAARRDDLAARIGGDEFALVCAGLEADAALAIAERIISLAAEPIAVDSGAIVGIGVSVGIAMSPTGGGGDGAELLRVADEMLYEAKAAGRGCARLAARLP